MNRLWKIELSATVALCAALAPLVSTEARGQQQQNPAAAMQAQQAQMEAQRQAQERSIQAQQQQSRAMQEQEMKAQQEARASQEQALKAQEENARRSQQQAMQAQQEQARKMQEQMQQAQRQQQEQAQRAQQEAQRQQQKVQEQSMKAQAKAQEQVQRQQQELVQHQQQEAQRQQQEAQRQQQESQRQQQEAMRQQQEQSQHAQRDQAQAMERAQEQAHGREAEMQHGAAGNFEPRGGGQPQIHENERGGSVAGMPPHAPNMLAGITPGGGHGAGAMRPMAPKALNFPKAVPVQKAISMPVVEGVPAEQNEHAQAVLRNLQEHLVAVPGSEAPRNFNINRNTWINNYTNNYWTNINAQRFFINRQNTYINSVLPNDYPYWYQPQPGWVFSNGFVLGNSIRCGLDWLRWGWHPYYGPPPDGFVCASDFIPTPWIYFPAYGLWQQPGVYGWAPSGPPYDYTGPITVEVLEPRHVHVRDPYTGWENQQVVNVVYLYNAFYDEEYEHWGYVNRHGYFIWLNI